MPLAQSDQGADEGNLIRLADREWPPSAGRLLSVRVDQITESAYPAARGFRATTAIGCDVSITILTASSRYYYE